MAGPTMLLILLTLPSSSDFAKKIAFTDFIIEHPYVDALLKKGLMPVVSMLVKLQEE